MTAGLAIQATTGLRSLPVSPWAGLGVLAGWTAATFLAGDCSSVSWMREHLRTQERDADLRTFASS
jgi:hypothetical protein